MGRRRRRGQSHDTEPGLIEVLIELAWLSPLWGAVASLVLLIAGAIVRGYPYEPNGYGRIGGMLIGLALLLIGGMGLLVSGVAFLRDLIRGRK